MRLSFADSGSCLRMLYQQTTFSFYKPLTHAEMNVTLCFHSKGLVRVYLEEYMSQNMRSKRCQTALGLALICVRVFVHSATTNKLWFVIGQQISVFCYSRLLRQVFRNYPDKFLPWLYDLRWNYFSTNIKGSYPSPFTLCCPWPIVDHGQGQYCEQAQFSVKYRGDGSAQRCSSQWHYSDVLVCGTARIV